MIEGKNVTFEYNKNEEVLKGANFLVPKGKITILLGNNGSGKTTLLNCIEGLFDLKRGEIEKKEDLIFIRDTPILYEYLTGREYLDLIHALTDERSRNKEQHLVRKLKLEDRLDESIIDYSLGMKHKMALVSSILLGYTTYLIDEPLTALDPNGQKFMINYFRQMKADGNTILISTHMMHIAYHLADEIMILDDGEITQINNDFANYDDFELYVLEKLNIHIESD